MSLHLSRLSLVILGSPTEALFSAAFSVRNVTTVAQLGATAHRDIETAVATAVKHHHGEEIQLIKESLAKSVRVLTSDQC